MLGINAKLSPFLAEPVADRRANPVAPVAPVASVAQTMSFQTFKQSPLHRSKSESLDACSYLLPCAKVCCSFVRAIYLLLPSLCGYQFSLSYPPAHYLIYVLPSSARTLENIIQGSSGGLRPPTESFSAITFVPIRLLEPAARIARKELHPALHPKQLVILSYHIKMQT